MIKEVNNCMDKINLTELTIDELYHLEEEVCDARNCLYWFKDEIHKLITKKEMEAN